MREFIHRHIGSNAESQKKMLAAIELTSIDELISKTLPTSIDSIFNVGWEGCTEAELLADMQSKADKNSGFSSYIGLGYYNTLTPSVILRNVLENPGWYSAYTPYQPEIAQGRLEALFYFQSMVADLTGLPIANASLLDEGTAAAEAMHMFYALKNRGKNVAKTFLVANNCFPQTIEVLRSRAKPYDINIIVDDPSAFSFSEEVLGVLLQYPGEKGDVVDYSLIISKAKQNGVYVAMACDLLALCLLRPPGEQGADVALGNAQRFGVPLGFGGPHAAFFAATDAFKRLIPGRIVGLSHDAQKKPCYRLALQTREQHIRREKATSNICTAQALLAIINVFYAMYHGPSGLKEIASRVCGYTHILSKALHEKGFSINHKHFFDTLSINVEKKSDEIKKRALALKINLRYDENKVLLSLDETVDVHKLKQIASIFECELPESIDVSQEKWPEQFLRKTTFLQHPVFTEHHSETTMMRYLKRLENRDLSLVHSMIPLGSCTMKLNAATELLPLTWRSFSAVHPFVPDNQVTGYLEIIKLLEYYLNTLTGFDHTTFQPNSGAQGEYVGLLVIKAYQEDCGEAHRDIALIPQSAHGTNPASAIMAGLKAISVKCLSNGDIDLNDLREKANHYKDRLSCLMVTYPSTHGVFEEDIQQACTIIHDCGGQVYMDGANMNAMMGLIKPKDLGVDVCHLNLHKTFCIPHGGGGPGMGPICMAKHLTPFTPAHMYNGPRHEKSIGAISSAAFGSASILLISYAYLKLCGLDGLKRCSEAAILHANYIKARLSEHYKILYTGKNGFVAHELIIDCRHFNKVKVEDIAKRLIDYGFHPPTMSWPVPETLMIEPTESESKKELDRFCEAMLAIFQEIKDSQTRKDNILNNAPHTLKQLMSDSWPYEYSRAQAAYPLAYLDERKFWPFSARVDNAYGDKNLVCSCFINVNKAVD